jgi:hypothetical protein
MKVGAEKDIWHASGQKRGVVFFKAIGEKQSRTKLDATLREIDRPTNMKEAHVRNCN